MALSVLLVASLVAGAKLSAWRERAARSLVAARADLAAAQEFAALLRGYPQVAPPRSSDAESIEAVLTRTLAKLHGSSGTTGSEMHLALVPRPGAVARAGAPEAGVPIAAYVETLPALARLKRVAIRVNGRYARLDDLQTLLEALDREPAALRGLRIERDTYEMSIDVYGH
jgi:hypothetical protein